MWGTPHKAGRMGRNTPLKISNKKEIRMAAIENLDILLQTLPAYNVQPLWTVMDAVVCFYSLRLHVTLLTFDKGSSCS
jgi:hypothetical protein